MFEHIVGEKQRAKTRPLLLLLLGRTDLSLRQGQFAASADILGDPTGQNVWRPTPSSSGAASTVIDEKRHLFDLIIYRSTIVAYDRKAPAQRKTLPSRIQQHYQRFCGRNGYRSPEAVKYRRRGAPKRRVEQLRDRKKKKGGKKRNPEPGKRK
ncbi:hypothetical protein BDV38DRAFT_29746 [Aspergillus pseudotamarii]|uniref:Uncharacterized protein n=1 Tax=Aspergillus pseudotamarii TaxID=132259 RepID=A0A5N6S9A0_ASPPS|nr:uncharacterized protein BDV38DRAFT_29746 [Aspergillus pseudotamarii]KAE8131222.1 hypothetical protein BDV38DRAFT_29746 [Aspergillus pseudotamarii]